MNPEHPTERALRDLAKSLVRFPWALSMFSVGQAVSLLASREGRSRSAATLDAVSHVAEDHLDETVRGFYQMGDRLQESVVDQMAAGARAFVPMIETAARIVRRSSGEDE